MIHLRRTRAGTAALAAGAAAVGVIGFSPAGAVAAAPHAGAPATAPSTPRCQLANGINHVVQLQFDNVHLTRDNPNVPSDLQQMPHLLNFIQSNGTMLSNHHDVLQHTATNVLSALTGLYEDRHGVTQSNSYRYFNPDGTTNPGVSFAYWTDPIYDYSTTTPTDTKYTMIYSPNGWTNPRADNVNTPAPWVAFTKAGCNVGSVATGNTVLENIGTDIPTVFGPGSPEAQEAQANPAQATADFVGLAVHCAKNAAPCAGDAQARPDLLPDEPGGYHGYQALYGNKYVAPAISPNGPVTSLSGNVITDSSGNVGFPGFDSMTPDNALAYVADMQEHGVPVTYAYISDAHDAHGATSGGYGPGEAGYVAQLKSYDAAFAAFFTRLQADGITAKNTLFVVTTDEGDKFVGGAPSPANCDGVTTPCTYAQKGEVNANLTGLLATQRNNTTVFDMHSDPSPAIYIHGNPAPKAPVVRRFEKDAAALVVTNLVTGKPQRLVRYEADQVEQKILHLTDADPARKSSLTLFAGSDYYLYGGAPNCSSPCVTEPPSYVWNHGAIGSRFSTIWLGLVGPGVRNLGTDRVTWSDQTDIRPTVLALTGLRDPYLSDGRVLVEDLTPSALPASLRVHETALVRLGQVYKQLFAADGRFGLATLQATTNGIKGSDRHYAAIAAQVTRLGAARAGVADRMRAMLNAAQRGTAIDVSAATALAQAGQRLLGRADTLAANS